MKPKLLFLAKFLGYALVLLAIWHPVSEIYLFVLNQPIGILNSIDNFVSGGIGVNMGKSSLFLIPLISLIAATPGVAIRRKAGAVGAGVLAFLLVDMFLLEYVLVIKGGSFQRGELAVYALHTNIKLLLPFLLWFITCQPTLRQMFTRNYPAQAEKRADAPEP